MIDVPPTVEQLSPQTKDVYVPQLQKDLQAGPSYFLSNSNTIMALEVVRLMEMEALVEVSERR
tara:strand:- start:143 stop:331 length:189 start_codon:yes stop_codon:yes gene_type:complete